MKGCCWKMLNEGDPESPEKSRERRRRRIEMRRVTASEASEASPAPEMRKIWSAEDTTVMSSSAAGDKVPAEPVFGTVSISGRSRYMEDAVTVRTVFSHPEMLGHRPVHFFAVYDGHGGRHVAELCKERMHVIVEEEMGRLRGTRGGSAGWGEDEDQERWWRRVMDWSFERMDEEAMSRCTCGSVANQCGCKEDAIGGSTAIVAMLTPDQVVVANVGDSRAVLCRGGAAFPLSDDHKPDRPDELARIEAAGGVVINFVNGARVEGILAMSRAIGDRYLKPYVISKPEITFTKRGPEDECLIIASDGLWDVLPSELACKVANKCLLDGIHSPATDPPSGGVPSSSGSSLVAALLTRLALGRKSADNISIIVIDLKLS